MATEFLLRTQRTISVLESGYAFDMRPGSHPEDWEFTNTYQWPMPSHVYKGNKRKTGETLPSAITLLPAVLDPLWDTTETDKGPYARHKLDQFSLVNGSWEEYPRLHPKDWVFVNKTGTYDSPAEIKSVQPLPNNRGLSINFCAFGPAMAKRTILSIDFGNNTASKKFTLNINQDGKGYLSRGNAPVEPLAEGYLVPNRWADVQGRWYKFFIIPIGKNRIMISSSTGGSFVWQDPSISRGNPFDSQEPKDLISALTQMAYYSIRAHQKVAIQPKPIAFVGNSQGSGETKKKFGLLTTLSNFFSPQRVPNLTAVNANNRLEYDRMTKNITSADVGVTFETVEPVGGLPPDRLYRRVLKPTVKLSRPDVTEEDQYHTPIFYRTEPSEEAVRQTVAASAEDVMPDLIEFTHNQEQKLMAGGIKLKNAHNHGNLKNVFNIPFEFKLENNVFLEGVITKPTWNVKYNQQFIAFDLQDMQRFLDNKIVQDVNRLDGLAIDDAVKKLLVAAGMPSDGSKWDIDPTPSYIERDRKVTRKLVRMSKGEADDDPTNLSDAAKTVTDWLTYIVENYTSSSEFPFRWVFGFRPYYNTSTELWEYRFFFKDPAKISLTQPTIYKFYASTDRAEAAIEAATTHAFAVNNAYKAVHRNLNSYLIEPEANALVFVGMDDVGEPILRYIEDKNSINGALAYGSQPVNWLGEKRIVVVIDSSFNTAQLVTAGIGKLFRRISKVRQHVSFEAEWEPRIRLWDELDVEYYLANGTTLVTRRFRVVGFNVTHTKDDQPGNNATGIKTSVKCTYQLERWYNAREN